MPVKEYTNRLIHEKSPYLLQHAHNPVDWYPWGEEAFSSARELDRPIFLSIGYSTCHWCHVMERESFENERVAEVLNRSFVCIKVDKEERPDVDAVYMAACQAMTGSGGWPLTVFMTPDQKPFLTGTYLPRDGRAGLLQVAASVARKWLDDRETLIEAGEDVRAFLRREETREPRGGAEISEDLVLRAISYFRRSFDAKNGGFGQSPKFPAPQNLFFLLRAFQIRKDDALLQMVEKTLQQMARGGIFDHIGGGFSRYSTDSRWFAPHFEKMLYDNALLSIAYLETYQVTQKPFYLHIVQQTLDYVLREMTGPQGGFYSAQDADSEGEEGRYYLFSEQEIGGVLGPEHGGTFCGHLDITPEGNFEGRNIPNRLKDDRYDEPLPTQWLEKLDAYRKRRSALRTDDKVLTGWNGLMIAAFAKAYAVMEDERYLAAAEKAMAFLLDRMDDGDGLAVWYRDGKTGGRGTIDDYAFTVWALLELYGATFDPVWLQHALKLHERQMSEFFDERQGGFYLYGRRGERLILRPKEVYDGAIPSGNSAAAVNLIRLSRLTGEGRLEQWAERQLRFLAGQIEDMPAGYGFSLLAILLALYPEQTVVCALPDERMLPRVRQMVSAAFLPRMTVLVKTPRTAPLLDTIAPFTKGNGAREQPTFYLCENSACREPVVGLEEWERRLAALQE